MEQRRDSRLRERGSPIATDRANSSARKSIGKDVSFEEPYDVDPSEISSSSMPDLNVVELDELPPVPRDSLIST